MQTEELDLEIKDHGSVDALLMKPRTPRFAMVLAHGAGASMRHAHMENLAQAFGDRGFATLRFNFPYMQAGKPRTDNLAVCTESFRTAISLLRRKVRKAPLLIGGHSFGGRMASHYPVESGDNRVAGVICSSFPLHNPKKPDTRRGEHLPLLEVPILFLSGTRDQMAEHDLIESVVSPLPHARLHWLHTGDHGFKVLKRTRDPSEDIYTEAGRVALDWADRQIT